MASILVVGASDTGRAPLAAALLRHLLQQRGGTAEISSAGVIGHEGDELQAQAQLTLEHMGVALPAPHRARALDEALANSATVLLAIDRGTARVLLVRYAQLADRIAALPQLANARDVPDPFHMSLDAWIVYGRAIQDQLRAALPELERRTGLLEPAGAEGEPGAAAADAGAAASSRQEQGAGAALPAQPAGQAGRLRELLSAMQAVPEIIDWARARQELAATLSQLGSQAEPGDMAPAVAAMLQGLLAQTSTALTSGQVRWLLEVAHALEQPINAATMAQIAAASARWPGL